jgi:hypothetical protein
MNVHQGLTLPALDAAGFATNPFRVLGLDLSASAGQVRRRAEQAAAAYRLGAARPLDCIVPLPFAPDDHLLRDAAHRLRDPMSRLLAEVSWFEPDPGPEPAWRLDRPAPTGTLMKTWIDLCCMTQDSGRRAAAAHNAAMLQLLLWTQDLIDGSAAGSRITGSRAAWWDVLQHLAIWLADDMSVRKVAARAAALGAAPTGNDLDPWRRELARALLRPLVDLALLLLEKGESAGAIWLLSHRVPTLESLPSTGVHPELRRLARKAENRIARIVDDAWSRAQTDEADAVAVGQRLLVDARPWFDVLETAAQATPSRPQIVALEDLHRLAHRLADILTACAINYLEPGDPLDRQRAASQGLEAAARISYDAEQRRQIKENLQAVRQNIARLERTEERPTCFQCTSALPAEYPVAAVPLVWPGPASATSPERDAAVQALGFTPGTSLLLGLPRCRKCHGAARRVRWAGYLITVLDEAPLLFGPLLGVLVYLVGLLAGLFQRLPGNPPPSGSFVIATLVLLASCGSPFVRRIRIARAVRRNPAVASLLALGYQLPRGWLDEQFTLGKGT